MLPTVSVQREVLKNYQEQYVRARYVAWVEHRLLVQQDPAEGEDVVKARQLNDLIHTMRNCDRVLAELDRLLKELE